MKVDYKKLDALSAKQEKQFIKELTQAYNSAYDDIAKEIGKLAVKGNLTKKEMLRFNRLTNLINSVSGELTLLNTKKVGLIERLIADTYLTNFSGVADKITDVVGLSINFPIPNKKAIYDSIRNPLFNLAIENNADEVKRLIKRDITVAIMQGESIPKMGNRIKESLGKNGNNAVRIARTETTGSLNRARLDAMNHADSVDGIILTKIWVATNDPDRTRPSHLALDGERRKLDEEFSNGLMYPADQNGSAEEVINCRCSMITDIEIVD